MDNKNLRTINPFAAGFTGFILGIAGVSALILSDEEIRRKVIKKANEAKKNLLKWSDDSMQLLHRKSYHVRKDLSEKIDPDQAKAHAKNRLDDRADEIVDEEMRHN